MPFVQDLFSKHKVYLIFRCDMIHGTFMFILSNGSDNCTKKYSVRIPFHWARSWLQLVLFDLKLFLVFCNTVSFKQKTNW